MKFITEYNKKLEIYNNYLEQISNVKFTFREIDIIACILHNRGEKKIASMLSISPRTVSVHTYNIMSKLGYNSRDHIIDFIEKSGRLEYFKQYYLHLLLDASFERCLKKIAKFNLNGITLTISSKEFTSSVEALAKTIENHLKLANIFLSRKSDDPENNDLSKLLVELLQNRTQNYYLALLAFVEKVINNSHATTPIQEFKDEYKALENSWKNINQKEIIEPKGSLFVPSKRSIITTIISIITIILLVSFFSTQQLSINNNDRNKLISELDELLSMKNHEFSDNNLIREEMHANYSIVKKIERILTKIDPESKIRYLTDVTISLGKLVNYLYNLHALSNYYMYNEHNGEKAREMLMHGQNLVHDYINSRSVVQLDFPQLSKEEIYNELAITKDLPEMYSAIIYSLGRTYIYHGNKEDGLKYFELSKYLGDKLELFEGYLSIRSGLCMIMQFRIEKDIRNGKYEEARKQLHESIKLYDSLKNDAKEYKINYKPGAIEPKVIIPKDDIYNRLECGERIAKQYADLITITKDIAQKEQYIKEILKQFLDTRDHSGILVDNEEISPRKQASVYNTLGEILLRLYDEQVSSKELIAQISKELNLTSHDELEIIKQIFEFASLKSRNTDFTKADSYNGIIKIYKKRLNLKKDITKAEAERLLLEISNLEEKRNTINKALKRDK